MGNSPCVPPPPPPNKDGTVFYDPKPRRGARGGSEDPPVGWLAFLAWFWPF